MKLSLPLLVCTLATLSFGLPLDRQSDISYTDIQSRTIRHDKNHEEHYEKRMLSAAFAADKGPKYAGKKLSSTDVAAIVETANQVLNVVKQRPGALVLAMGNSPSYILDGMSEDDKRAHNIFSAPISGGLPEKIPKDKATKYAQNVLGPIIQASPHFTHVVLLDIYTSGSSKTEYKALLKACEPILGLSKGKISNPTQIPIIDKTAKRPSTKTSRPVPFACDAIRMPVSGLALGLTNGEYPRRVINYPIDRFEHPPSSYSEEDQLDAKGGSEIYHTIQAGIASGSSSSHTAPSSSYQPAHASSSASGQQPGNYYSSYPEHDYYSSPGHQGGSSGNY